MLLPSYCVFFLSYYLTQILIDWLTLIRQSSTPKEKTCSSVILTTFTPSQSNSITFWWAKAQKCSDGTFWWHHCAWPPTGDRTCLDLCKPGDATPLSRSRSLSSKPSDHPQSNCLLPCFLPNEHRCERDTERNSRTGRTTKKSCFCPCYCFLIKTLMEWKPPVFMGRLKDGAPRGGKQLLSPQ